MLISTSNVMPSNSFFCPNNSPKHMDSSFIVIKDTEKQQILTFKRLNQQFLILFYLKNDWKYLITKIQ